ncbi:MAG TPA: hypothetical protein VK325_01955 [Pseudoxanthomonas sp.]|nr:hypothetical protein [Pseudoxanthomonas sp.]
MKTHHISIQRFRAASQVMGKFICRPMPPPAECGSRGAAAGHGADLTEDNVRVLVTLLKAQLANADKGKACSRLLGLLHSAGVARGRAGGSYSEARGVCRLGLRPTDSPLTWAQPTLLS